MKQQNQVGSYIQPYKGLLQHLTDQVMAKLTSLDALESQAEQPGVPRADDASEPASFFYDSGQTACMCAGCSVLRQLV